MIYADCHTHTSFSCDSEEPMKKMVEMAIDKKLKYICFTEHQDLDFPEKYGHFLVDIPSYRKELNNLKEIYKDKIKILYGIEFGLMPHLVSEYNELANENDFDFIIGSSHLVEGMDPYYEDFWENRTEEEGYMKYFENVLSNVKIFSDFDVYGHIDYIVRYGKNKNKNYSYKKYADILDEILKEIITKGKGIEVNTAGYKYGLGNPNPHYDVLQRYKELGGEILTIGSDSHDVKTIANQFDIVCNNLKDIGFKYYTVFEKRKPIFLKL